MTKQAKFVFRVLLVLLLLVFATGCDIIQKEDAGQPTDFKRGEAGLEMEFLSNYPGNSYILSEDTEGISVVIEVKNKGTYPENPSFGGGEIYISGFDDRIIDMTGLEDSDKEGKTVEIDQKQLEGKTNALSGMFLSAASPINPLGGFDTAEFEGEIIAGKITVDEYTPTILATVCYPYATKASPTVCVDPQPFDDKQEKVCNIGSQILSTQGAPVAVTKIEQEASTGKIQFKIHVKNVGGGDVIKTGDSDTLEEDDSTVPTLSRCSPLGNGSLHRKDFDRVQLQKVQIGDVDLLKDNKCSPFADGTANSDKLIRLFEGEGFVICTLTVKVLGPVESAYTTPINIELGYNYRSTISKSIKISKLTTVG